MAIETVRPSSTPAAGGSSPTGAGSLHAATNDDSDASYFEVAGAASTIAFTPPSAGGEVAVRLRVRSSKGTGVPARVDFTSNGTDPFTRSAVLSWLTPATGTWLGPFGGSDWPIDSFDIADPRLTILNRTGFTDPAIYELYLDYVSIDAGVVTVTGPSGTLTTTNLPEVIWTEVLDNDGGPQTSYQVKIFTDAQYGAGGFSADTSDSYHDSGELAGNDLAYQLTDILPDDTYRAYVRVAQTVNGDEVWSAWDFEGFVIDVDKPGEPTLTLTAQSDDGRIKADLAAPNLDPNPSFEVDTTGVTLLLSATGTRTPVNALNGDWSLRVDTPGSVTGEGFRKADITVTPSKTYTRTYWVLAPLGATLQLELRELTSGAVSVGQTTTNFTGTGEYQRVEVSRAFGGTGAKARSTMTTRSTAQAISFWVDQGVLNEGPGVDTEFFQLQHSVEGGPWENVRTLLDDGVISDGDAFAYDFEVPNGEPEVDYRARAINGDVYSDWVFGTSEWESAVWWLKHPTLPAMNLAVTPYRQSTKEQTSRQGVFQPLGRSDPVIVSDVRSTFTGEVSFIMHDDEERDAFEALLAYQVPFLLQGATATNDWNDYWVKLGDLTRSRAIEQDWGELTFDAVAWIAVARPTGAIEEWPVD